MRLSLWLDGARPLATDPFPPAGERSFDAAVVGAGITGVTTAVMLARAGRRVVLVEARNPGAVTTGNTTAKVSVLHGNRAGTILRRHSAELASAYLQANLAGQDWLVRFCDQAAVELQIRRAVSFSQTGQELAGLDDDMRALEAAGLEPVRIRASESTLPFRVAGGIGLDGQYQFDPVDFLAAASDEFRRHGGTLLTGTRLVGVATLAQGGGVELRLASSDPDLREPVPSLRARRLVLATGAPVLDRGLQFARMRPLRHYAVAFHAEDPTNADAPREMLTSIDGPSRSLRDATAGDGIDRLIVGGGGHIVGRKRDTEAVYREIETWTARYYPDLHASHWWSAQDYEPLGAVPLVGPVPAANRDPHTILIATGFGGWGMTNGVAAAQYLASLAGGGSEAPAWARTLYGAHPTLRTTASVAALNLDIGRQLVTGTVHRDGPACTHLGGRLRWNPAERSWDCPLHGSRFSEAGCLLEGPATEDLPLVPEPPDAGAGSGLPGPATGPGPQVHGPQAHGNGPPSRPAGGGPPPQGGPPPPAV